MTRQALLEIRDLEKHFCVRRGPFSGSGPVMAAVDGVSLTIGKGEVFGLAGESGSGKSTLARIIVQLLRADAGQILYKGRVIETMNRNERREVRQKVQMVFQDPSAALSPRRSILQTLTEPLDLFDIGAPGDRPVMAAEALETVGLDRGALRRLPHQFSSGQRQRIGIARALLTDPELIIADEAVSALDVSVQAQILELVLKLQKERGIAFLFISHDLAVIRHVANTVGILYRGQLVELAESARLFANPAHPYTRQLLATVPDPDPAQPPPEVTAIAGLARLPSGQGCVFAHRCPQALEACTLTEPAETAAGGDAGHRVKCHLNAVGEYA